MECSKLNFKIKTTKYYCRFVMNLNILKNNIKKVIRNDIDHFIKNSMRMRMTMKTSKV